MRRWGFVISVFYAAFVLVLLLPGFYLLAFKYERLTLDILKIYEEWGVWILAGILATGEALLLFLSVDTSWRHAKPRQHVAVTAILASFFAAVLTIAAISSLALGIGGKDEALSWYWNGKDGLVVIWRTLGWLLAMWGAWGAAFLLYCRGAPERVTTIVSWLLKGSVLELLIAVPAHIIVRQRGDCSAPFVTGFGIVTGIAIMLLCFGPSVLALYKKRLDAYSRKPEQSP